MGKCDDFETGTHHHRAPPLLQRYEGGYLQPEEIPKYCGIIEGVTTGDVRTASILIDGYLGRSYAPKQFTDRIKLFRHHRGHLSHYPVISIDKVVAHMNCIFGCAKDTISCDEIELDPENDGYFTFVGSGGFNTIIYRRHPHILEITYTSGFDSYPERLKTACGMLACNIRQAMSFSGAKQLSSLDFEVMMTDDSFFTSDIKMLLRGLD